MIASILPIARYQLCFKVVEPIHFCDYAGSALRGVFGRSLRTIACMTRQKSCEACPLYRTCPYPAIFETPAPIMQDEENGQRFTQVPNAYIIEPPDWGKKYYAEGDELSFNLVLFGRLIDQLPLIVFAWQKALARNISGGKATLQDVYYLNGGERIAVLAKNHILPHQAQLHLPDTYPSQMGLNFITPLRLQANSKPLGVETITVDRFLIGLAKRFAFLHEFHATPCQLDFAQLQKELQEIEDKPQLHWLDWQRYSSRQQQTMRLGGVVGQWDLYGLSENWAKLLYIGQWLHVGKNATFGLGRYQITNL